MTTVDESGDAVPAEAAPEVPSPPASPPEAPLEPPPRPIPADIENPWGIAARSVALGTLIAVCLLYWSQMAIGGRWVVPFISENQLEMPQRMRLIYGMVVSGVLGALVTGGIVFVAHRRRWGLAHVERWLWFLSPTLLLPFLPQIYRFKPWKDHPELLLPLLLVLALVAEVVCTRSFRAVPDVVRERVGKHWSKVREKAPAFLRKHGPLLCVCVAVTVYVVFMGVYNVRWHHKMKTHNFDLAIDNNLIFSALKGAHMESTVTQGNNPGQYLATHAKLGQYVILPIYALYPKPETLIVIQGLLLGLGALPLFGFAKRFVSSWMAVGISLCYLAYHPLHSANFCESKYLSLSGFFVLATFWAIEYKRPVLYGLAFVCAMLMREDVPVGLAVGGMVLLLSGRRPLYGGITIVVSVVWFLILRSLMDKAGSWWFPGMYKGLWSPGQEGYGSVLKTVITNPLFVLNRVIEKDKVIYLMHLLVPLAFLPARRWYLWAAFLPGTALTLFVTDYKPIFGYSFQYVMHWVPYLFLAVPLALAAIQKSSEDGVFRARGAFVAMALATSTMSYNYGAFARRPSSVKGGYFYIDFTISEAEEKRYAELKEIIRDIPPDASVVATEQVGPHVSSRRLMYALRRGVYDAEYMLAAKSELDFEQTRKLFTESVKSNKYGVIKRVGEFVLLKKGADPKDNGQLIADWKL